MAAGFRSLAAFWAGGASASSIQAGVRSPAAFWLGGASARVNPATQAGVYSLLAFWLGGAGARPRQGGGGGGGHHQPHYTAPQLAKRRLDDADLQSATDRLREGALEAQNAAQDRNVGTGFAATRVDGQRFAAAELEAVMRQLSPSGGLPPLVRLPTRTISPETASEDDMALLMFALYIAMDD